MWPEIFKERKGTLVFSAVALMAVSIMFILFAMQGWAIFRFFHTLENNLDVYIYLDDHSSSLVSLMGAENKGMLYMEAIGYDGIDAENMPDSVKETIAELHEKMDEMGIEFSFGKIEGTSVLITPGGSSTTTVSTGASPDINLLLGKTESSLVYDRDIEWAEVVDVDVTGENHRLQRPVMEAFMKMYEAAKKERHEIYITSGFRSFEQQKDIWNKKYDGKNAECTECENDPGVILEQSSFPGTSRHHWGTDLDWVCKKSGHGLNNDFYKSAAERSSGSDGQCYAAYQWMLEHAKEYGFYQTYTAGRTKGYNEERWHWSYLPIAAGYLKAYKEKITPEVLFSETKEDGVKGHPGGDDWHQPLISKSGSKEITFTMLVNDYVMGIPQEVLDYVPATDSLPSVPVPLGGNNICEPVPVGGECRTVDPGNVRFAWPVDDITQWTITSGYGYRDYSDCDCHGGVDIGLPSGTSVLSAGGGTVTTVHSSDAGKGSGFYGFGKVIVIDHGNGFSTIYAHLSETLVSVGDNVQAGYPIAKSGSSGSGGVHLHFEIFQTNHNKPGYESDIDSVNPCVFLVPSPEACVHADDAACVAIERYNCKSHIPGTTGTLVSIPTGSWSSIEGGPAPSSYITEIPLPGGQPKYIKGVAGGMVE